jgi:hypothetical protein
MKTLNNEMESTVAESLLVNFRGLSEKSASKMIKSIEYIAKSLAKKFYKLQSNDCRKVEKNEKKLMKKVDKEVKKEKIKAKVALIIATEKPKSMLAMPLETKLSTKKTNTKLIQKL